MTTRRRIFAVTLSLVAVGAGLAGLRVYSDAALQAYATELRGRGEGLTVLELTASYSASASGWGAQFTKQVTALGPAPADPGKLGLADHVAPNLARITWSLSQPPWGAFESKATNVSWLELARQLSAVRPALRELQQLLRQPSPNSGRPTNWFDFRPVWPEMKSAAGWLACDVLASLREDRKDDALTSLQAFSGLVAMYREDRTLVQQMSRVTLSDVGLDLTWEALQAEGWSTEQLTILQHCWEDQELIAAVELGLQGERALPLECLSWIRQHQKPNKTGPGFLRPAWPFNQGFSSFYRNVALPNDALYGLRYLQSQVELMRELRDGRPYYEIIVVFRDHQAVLDAKAKSITRIFYPLSLIAFPAYEKAVTRGAKVEVKRRLAITTLALRRYQLRHGHWPADLAALLPEFLRDVPRDCMAGQALKYRVNKDDTFTLYSVGVDGIDQGGDPTPVKPSLTGLGEGLDTVWPVAQRAVKGKH